MSNLNVSRAALLAGAFSMLTAVASAGPVDRRGVRQVTLPAGTLLPLTLDSYVASDTSRIESPVHAHLRARLSSAARCCRPARGSVASSLTHGARLG